MTGVLETTTLDLVPTYTSGEIRSELACLDLTDDEEVRNFTLKLASSLCAFDTQTMYGSEFNQMQEYILAVMQDQLKAANLETGFIQCYFEGNPIDRKMLVIAPRDENFINNLKLQYLAKQKGFSFETVDTTRNIVHCHIDTASVSKGLSTLKTFHNSSTNVAFAKGIVDMKSSIVSTILMLEMMIKEGFEDFPAIIFTADEEVGGIYGGLDLVKLINSSGIFFDLECNPTNTAFINEIKARVEMTIEDCISPKKILRELEEEIVQIFGKGYLPMINTFTGELKIGLLTENKQDADKIIGLLMKKGIIVNPKEASVKVIPGAKSRLSKPSLGEIDKILSQTYPFEGRVKPSKGVGSVSGLQQGYSNIGYIYNNFASMATIAYENGAAWGILGPMEKGKGRHTDEEGVDLSHPLFVARAAKEILVSRTSREQ